MATLLKSVRVELPFPISANVYWGHRAIRRGNKWIVQTYVTPAAREYRNLVRLLCVQAGHVPTGRSVSITVHAWMPATDRDLMNSSKVLEDALEGALYHDDNQIVWARYVRHEAKPPKRTNAKVTVTVEEIQYDGT